MNEKYQSVFDIVGPVMVGPSSSHTAGAAKLGFAAGKLLPTRPDQIQIDYYESFAKTHAGHGTDFAIVAGILGMETNDPRLPESLDLVHDLGIPVQINEMQTPSPLGHPNTAQLTLWAGQKKVSLWGDSIGGGKIEVKQIQLGEKALELPGPLPVLLFSCPPSRLPQILAKMATLSVVVTAQNFCQLNQTENLYALNLQKEIAPKSELELSQLCHNLICL